MSQAKRYALQVQKLVPTRGISGKFEKAPTGDRLQEKAREERARAKEAGEHLPVRQPIHGKRGS